VIGVFGGTFSPIHHGHLRLAIELAERFGLERVHVIPSGDPPHRARPRILAERRLEWVRLAVADEPRLIADDREVRRGGRSYTYDTLVELREEYRDQPLVLMLGDDAANQFHNWHRWKDIAQLVHLAFVERPYEPPQPDDELSDWLRGHRVLEADALRNSPGGRWISASIPPLSISSTRIRRLLKAGRSIRGLVPESVIRSMTAEDISLLTHNEEAATD